MVFACSMGDLFHPDVPDWVLEKIFGVIGMAKARQHVFLILTKRPERMRLWMSENYPIPLSHVWLGVSVENQDVVFARIPFLLKTPAAIRFVSCEPLLGEVILDSGMYGSTAFLRDRLDWVIAGGESGPGARCPDPDWVRS